MLQRTSIRNASVPRFGDHSNVLDLIREQGRRHRNKSAVVGSDSQKWTYSELLRRADTMADWLIRHELKPSERVGIAVTSSAVDIAAVLGVLCSGGAYLPFDATQPKARWVSLLQKAGVRFVIHGAIPQIPPMPFRVLPKSFARRNGKAAAVPVSSSDLAYVIHTSGSTGGPKPVQITHRNLWHSTQARIQYYRNPVERFLLLSPLTFDSSIAGLFWTLATGGTLILPPAEFTNNLEQLPSWIDQHQVSHLLCIPGLWSGLLRRGLPRQLQSLRNVIVAGETCPAELPSLHFQTLPDTSLHNEYGPTEATVWCTVAKLRSGPSNGRSQPIGRPIARTQVLLLDEEMNSVGGGEIGRVFVSGAGISPGYLNDPELTRQKFVDNPAGGRTHGRMYDTGDLARLLEDGSLEFVGRSDDQIKLRGHRIELSEIEAAILAVAGIREAAVVKRGNSLAAFVSVDKGLPIANVKRLVQRRLPRYMVPAEFRQVDQLPRNPHGKVDRRALVAKFDGAAGHTPSCSDASLYHVVGQLLGRSAGPSDNFLEIGGDSLTAMELSIQLEQLWGIRPMMAQFFATKHRAVNYCLFLGSAV